MKKKKTIKIESNQLKLIKETPEQRYERVTSSGSEMRTRIVPDKKNKIYTRCKQKIKNRKEVEGL